MFSFDGRTRKLGARSDRSRPGDVSKPCTRLAQIINTCPYSRRGSLYSLRISASLFAPSQYSRSGRGGNTALATCGSSISSIPPYLHCQHSALVQRRCASQAIVFFCQASNHLLYVKMRKQVTAGWPPFPRYGRSETRPLSC